jgi:hypothetical protein
MFNRDLFRVLRGSLIVVWISQVTCICLHQSFRLQSCLRFDFEGWYHQLWKPQTEYSRQFISTVQYMKRTVAMREQLLEE